MTPPEIAHWPPRDRAGRVASPRIVVPALVAVGVVGAVVAALCVLYGAVTKVIA